MPSLALRAALVQFVLALTWIVYVLHLPALLDLAGIDRRWFVWILLADQITFVLADWAAGAWADRLAAAWSRFGRLFLAAAVGSSLLMLSLPWLAATGSGVLLLLVTFAWTLTSSALRAPLFTLLGRMGADARTASRLAGAALAGAGFASAVGPWMATALRGGDPRIALGIGAMALIAAAWIAASAQPSAASAQPSAAAIAPGARPHADGTGQAAWLPAGLLVVLLGFGVQVHTILHSEALYRAAGTTTPMLWMPAFWLGFALLCVLADALPKPRDPAAVLPWAAAAGTLALLLARQAPALPVLAALQCAAGAAWGLFMQALFARATHMAQAAPARAGAGSATGVLFSAMAVAAAARLAVVAGGWQSSAALSWAPVGTWACAALLLVLLPAARRLPGPHTAIARP